MYQTLFSLVANNLISFLLLSPLLFLIFKHLTSPSPSPPLPPGPRPWPILGNILQMGPKPHISMTHFAKLYGPLISLKLGSQLVVVASSPSAAAEILKTHDRLLSARSVPDITSHQGSDITRLSLIWSDCTDHWRFLRSLCRAKLFSGKALESTAMIREEKVHEMVEFLSSCKEGRVVNIAQVVSTTVLNSITCVFFSRSYCWYGGDVESKLKEVFLRAEELVSTPNLADLFPVFARFDLQGLKKKGLEMSKEFEGLWEEVVKERREGSSRLENPRVEDFLDVLIANGFENDQISYLAIELLSAAADTTTSAVEWTMVELIRNKEAMKKVQQELTTQLINQDSIKESNLSHQLPYLLACVMESLRLHPPVPLLLPHRALESCQVMSYSIPKDTRVFVNLWAIGRNPKTWEDPLSFKPERFLNSNMGFLGQDFEYLPFGSGRRICPGQAMASKQVLLILAHLLYCFDWCLPNGEDPAHLDMSEKLSFSLHKEQPLCLIPTRKP